MDTVPAATGGVWAARWATKLAGPFENDEPGIKHAIAIWLAAKFGAEMIGSMFGSSAKGEYARIGALAFGGDLFLRKRFLKDSTWAQQNITLAGVDDGADDDMGGLGGFESSSQLGDTFTDAMGNTYQQTAQGWALAGLGEGDGTATELYEMGGFGNELVYPAEYAEVVSGFEQSSPLGFPPASGSHSSSFGYA